MKTIGLVANVYNEVNALPGWLETHAHFFDHIAILHAGPQGAPSTDGTIELLEKWHIPITFTAIDEGFGVVRTKALRLSPCDWVMLLDADERFYATTKILNIFGEATPDKEVDEILQSYDFKGIAMPLPNWENLSRLGSALKVANSGAYNQGDYLRALIEEDYDAVVTSRRHWHDFTFKRPTQNWLTHPDWQMRCVRNAANIAFESATRMHERLYGAERIARPDNIFFDHFHFTFKRMEQTQRAHDVAIYDAIHKGEKPPKWEEFNV